MGGKLKARHSLGLAGAASGALAEITRVLSESLDPDEVGQQVVEAVRRLMGTELAALYRIEANGDLARVFMAVPPESTNQWLERLPTGNGLIGFAVRHRQLAATPDLLRDARLVFLPETQNRLRSSTLRAALAAPLLIRNQVVGAILVRDVTGRRFNEEETTLMRMFADHATLALENARRFAESEARRRMAEALAGIGHLLLLEYPDPVAASQRIADSVRELLNTLAAAVYRLQPDSEDLVVVAVSGDAGPAFVPNMIVPSQTGVVGRALAEGRVVVTPDVLTDSNVVLTAEMPAAIEEGRYHSVLAVPLLVDGRAIGAIGVRDRAGRTFQEDEIRLVGAFADQAALALHNAELHAEAVRRTREAEILADIARTINSSLDLGVVLQQVAEAARELCHSDMAMIALRDPEADAAIVRYRSGAQADRYLHYRIEPGKGVGGQVLLTGRPFRTDDVEHDPQVSKDYLGWSEQDRSRASMAVPIRIGDHMEGLLYAQHRTSRHFSGSDEAILVRLAEHAATAIRNATLYEQERIARVAVAKSAQRLSLLHDIDRAILAAEAPSAIAEAALWRLRDLLGVPRAIVNLFDVAAGEVEWLAAVGRRHSRLGPGVRYSLRLAGDLAALRRGEPQIIDVTAFPPSRETELLLASDVRVYMVVPMLFRGELIGSISFGGPTGEFPPEHVSIAQEVAAQLAIVIEQARLRERAVAAEQQYRGIFENAVEGIYRSTREGRFLLVNPAMARIFGYESPGHMLASVTDIGQQLYVDPEDRQALVRRLDEDGVVSRFENQMRRTDGAIIWVSQSLRAARNEHGSKLYYEGVLEDVTERKRSEAALRQSEKLAAMGHLLAGVAHELNNPLSVILGHTLLLQKTDSTQAARAQKISQAADRCARIVRSFLALAREQRPERKQVDLNQVVREAVELLAYQLRVDSVEVTLDLAEDLPTIWADPNQLHQVLVNLVTNAHQAIREGSGIRRITLRTTPVPGGGQVHLTVADTGPGIPPEIQRRIFEPFFTTKPLGQGTGLGLALCHGIVQDHGGRIRVESPPGEGARFTVELAIGTRPADAASDDSGGTQEVVRSKRILVVDDEAEVADVLAEILKSDGHRVDTAPNGVAALDRLREHAYDLILSDMKMPEMDGPGLFREVQRRHPALARRFIFITGDVLGADTREVLDRVGGPPSVRKPYDLTEIRRVILGLFEG